MGRLILVPQYPAKLRYQEWWYSELPKSYAQYFDAVIVLGQSEVDIVQAPGGEFSPMEQAITFEMRQIQEYLALELGRDDVLLLCDISFPGLFGDVLFHKRPAHCYAICHATSKNRFDYFSKDRPGKWKVESGQARLFDFIFVATTYHSQKIGWGNTVVTGLPLPPSDLGERVSGYTLRNIIPYGGDVVSVARTGVQKRNQALEQYVETTLGIKITHPHASDWKSYYSFLSASKVLLITAKEETFGYQVVDAIANNCIPIAPNGFSYPELLPREYLYDNTDELIDRLKTAKDGGLPVPKLLNEKRCKQFFGGTTKVMQGGIMK